MLDEGVIENVQRSHGFILLYPVQVTWFDRDSA
jgi:hypothetical protein